MGLRIALAALFGIAFSTFGCQFSVNFGDQPGGNVAVPCNVPREGAKVAQVAYVIEPPDLLTVELFKSLPDRPLAGERLVRTDGTIDLGFYGAVCVAGLTIDQARDRVEQYLSATMAGQSLGVECRQTCKKFLGFENLALQLLQRSAIDRPALNDKFAWKGFAPRRTRAACAASQ